MPFVKRDAAGRIAAVHAELVENGLEPIDPHSPELAAFMAQGDDKDDAIRRSFSEADAGFIRVLEDLIDVLIQRGYIQFSDFPEAAQKKMMDRRGLRREYAYLQSLFGGGDDGWGGGMGGGGWV